MDSKISLFFIKHSKTASQFVSSVTCRCYVNSQAIGCSSSVPASMPGLPNVSQRLWHCEGLGPPTGPAVAQEVDCCHLFEAGESNPSIGSKSLVNSLGFFDELNTAVFFFAPWILDWNHDLFFIEMWWIRWIFDDFLRNLSHQRNDSIPRRRAGDIAGEAWEFEAQRRSRRGKISLVLGPYKAFMAPGLRTIRALQSGATSIKAQMFQGVKEPKLKMCRILILVLFSSSQPLWN